MDATIDVFTSKMKISYTVGFSDIFKKRHAPECQILMSWRRKKYTGRIILYLSHIRIIFSVVGQKKNQGRKNERRNSKQ